jgi:hypothetical protein
MNADLFTPPPGCLSEYQLDRLRAGELAPARAEAVRAHVTGCPACAAKLATIEDARRAFVQAAPPFPAPPPSARRRRAPLLAVASLGAAAAAALALFVLPDHPAGLTRTKGGHHVTYFVEGPGGLRAGAPGEPVRPGERVQLVLERAAGSFVAVLGRDGSGRAVILHPEQGALTPLPEGERVSLPFSVQIDDAPGPEEIHVLLCASPVAVEPVRAALSAPAGALVPPPGCLAETIRLSKESR